MAFFSGSGRFLPDPSPVPPDAMTIFSWEVHAGGERKDPLNIKSHPIWKEILGKRVFFYNPGKTTSITTLCRADLSLNR